MENWKKDSRKDIVMVDVDALVPPGPSAPKSRKSHGL